MSVFIIEKEKIQHNISAIRQYAGTQKIIAVLKNDAYGLGLTAMARILYEKGLRSFAVTQSADALLLRALYPDAEVLMLGPVYQEKSLLDLLLNQITLTITSFESAALAEELCCLYHIIATVHIGVDTGMGRFGFPSQNNNDIVRVYTGYPHLSAEGIFTHFYDCRHKSKHTARQLHMFEDLLEKLRQQDIQPGLIHAANSAALFCQTCPTLDAVRIGSAFTGRVCGRAHPALKKVGYIKSEVCEIRCLPAGHNVGYGGMYKARKDMRIAIIPAGYGDGLHMVKAQDAYRVTDVLRYIVGALRCLRSRSRYTVAINGRQLPVVGRIGMGHIAVDLQDTPCAVGECVRLESNLLLSGRLLEKQYL